MQSYFIDSNILIDIMQGQSLRREETSAFVADLLDEGARLIINPIVYAEISVPFASTEDCARALVFPALHHEDIPQDAAFLAGKAFLLYRRSKGNKTSPLPDFFIGAHALVKGYALLTRDNKRYRKYFPALELIMP